MGLKELFALHERRWREFRHVYPVISRRARGLSIGVNLSPSAACNFDCVYCQVDRSFRRTTTKVDLTVLERELRHVVGNYASLFEEPEFRQVPQEFRRLNDIAFSGDGEPTASPVFPEAAHIAASVREQCHATEARIVVITNGCFLTRPAVAEALEFLDGHNGQLWVKLDAGTEEYYRRINRPSHPLQHVLDDILAAARQRPIVIQSLFLRVDGSPAPAGGNRGVPGALALGNPGRRANRARTALHRRPSPSGGQRFRARLGRAGADRRRCHRPRLDRRVLHLILGRTHGGGYTAIDRSGAGDAWVAHPRGPTGKP